MTKSVIYLDHAAATPIDRRVWQTMQPYLSQKFYNPSATYLAATQVRKDLEAARATVSHWLGVRPSEIIFTAGGTEANNLAIHGVMRQHSSANVVVSQIEHDSVLLPARDYEIRTAPVKPDGRIDLTALESQIDEHTVLISIQYANNEIGTIQPLRQIGQIIKRHKRNRKNALPLLFHTDACQAANYLDLHVARLGVDLLSLNGGKIYGPKQSGVLYVKAGVQLEPLIKGGGQERNLRSGTENVAAAIGLAIALKLAQSSRHEEGQRLQQLQNIFYKLLSSALPEVRINGSLKWRLPNNLHITLPGKDNERLLVELEQTGILAAAGSACSASDEEPSHVLKSLGLTDEEARSSLRFSMGRDTTEPDIVRTVSVLARL